jgi:pyruvoyl-dependent arginine decarboxylase (PvlArgDC)
MVIATAVSTSARILGLAILGTMLALASAAQADTPAECRGVFQSADVNNDGLLSEAEIAASDDIDSELATTLADRQAVTLSEFMAACRD